MSEEQHRESKLSDDRRHRLHLRVSKILDETQTRATSFRDRNGTDGLGFGFGIGSGGDVKVSVVGRDGFRVTMEMHKSVLEEKSRFFDEKIGVAHYVEISDCDDVEVYVETLVLMYCDDFNLKKRLMGEDVSKILALLKVINRTNMLY